MNDERVGRDLERQVRALKVLIKSANTSVREIERRLRWAAGTLNRLFAGRTELKVRHVLMVLDELGVEPEAFYRLAYGDERPEQTLAERIFELLGDRPKPHAEPVKALPLDEAEMEIWMREMFDRLVAERAAKKPED